MPASPLPTCTLHARRDRPDKLVTWIWDEDARTPGFQFDEKTEPTYNYDYQMIETNSDDTHTADIDASLKASLSYGFIKAQLNVKVKAHKESTRKSHFEFSSSSQTTAREMAADFSLKARGYRESLFRGKLEDHLERLSDEDHDQGLRPRPQRGWG